MAPVLVPPLPAPPWRGGAGLPPVSRPQFSLLTGLGALGLMIWLTATPHSRETEQKRLGMLVGFAFLTGTWAPGNPPRSRGTPPRLSPRGP